MGDKTNDVRVKDDLKNGIKSSRMAYVTKTDIRFHKESDGSTEKGNITWRIKEKDWKFSGSGIVFDHPNNFSSVSHGDYEVTFYNSHRYDGSYSYKIYLVGIGSNKGLYADSDPTVTNTGLDKMRGKSTAKRRTGKTKIKRTSKKKGK